MTDCQTCIQIKEKKDIIYEDDSVAVLVPEAATCHGHLIVVPKNHANTLDSIPDAGAEQLFFVANNTASALFQTLGAQGTNMIASSGNIYKDDGTHFQINVIPRKQNDGLNFTVNGDRAAEADLDAMAKKIKDKTDLIGVVRQKKEVIDLDKKSDVVLNVVTEKKEEKKTEEKQEDKKTEQIENYLVKQLRRIP